MFYNFKIIKLAKFLFGLSFILGNIFLFGFIIFDDISFAIGGYEFLLIAGIVNFFAFVTLILVGVFNKKYYDECLKSALILLLNIPFAALYSWIGLSII